MPKNDNPSSPNTSSPDDTKEQHYELRNRQVRRESVETEYSDGASSFEDVTTSAAEEEFDEENFTQLLSQLFPSEYLKEKNNSRKKKGNKKRTRHTESEEDEEPEPESKKKKKNTKRRKEKVREITPDEEESATESKEDSETGTGTDSDYDPLDNDDRPKINIIITLGNGSDDYEDEDSDDDDDDSEEEDSDDDSEVASEAEELHTETLRGSSKKHKSTKIPRENTKDDNKGHGDVEERPSSSSSKSWKEMSEEELVKEQKVISEMFNQIEKMKQDESSADSPVVEQMEKFASERKKELDKHLKKKTSKTKAKNLASLRQLSKEKAAANDNKYFAKLEMEQQSKILKQLEGIQSHFQLEKPYRFKVLEMDIPDRLKGIAMRKVNALRYMEPGAGEYYKVKNWIDTFMAIPFNTFNHADVSIADGKDKCSEFMDTAVNTLNEAVYGLNDAKMQILQMVGTWLSNPQAIGNAIAIKGPPGTGKTTLVKEGISKLLGRPFEFIALGGSTDSSFLEGHSYTYEGSTWGKIVSILIKSKCMNPVIYFDELDKVSDTPKGQEIIGILMHLIDTSQNTQFHDKYFADIDFDLSKCLFIFSYNDENLVNPILRDRMYKIETKGYQPQEKTIIVNNHLLPKIREQVRFEESEISIPDEVVTYIVEKYTNKEKGVRNLKRCLETLHTKLNLYRLTTNLKSDLFKEKMLKDVSFPLVVTRDIVDTLLKLSESEPFLNTLYT
jgi:ATP-dependent Lon protease